MKGKIEIPDVILDYLIEKVFNGRVALICNCGEELRMNCDKEEWREHIKHLISS